MSRAQNELPVIKQAAGEDISTIHRNDYRPVAWLHEELLITSDVTVQTSTTVRIRK